MTLLLAWLALPLLMLPACVAPWRHGRAAARIIMTTFALAALWQGIGTLMPLELRELGRSNPESAQFIAFTAGVGLAATVLMPLRGVGWQAAVLGWPAAVGFLISIVPNAWLAAVVGIATGVAPAIAGTWWSRRRSRAIVPEPEPILVLPEAVAVIVALAVLAWRGPVIASTVAIIGLVWWAWLFRGHSARWSRWPVLPIAVTLMVGTWAWLSLTVAGAWTVSARGYDAIAPVSPAAGILVAALGLTAATLVAAPWPLHVVPRSAALVPAAGLLVATLRGMVPDGVLHWLPLVTGVAVLAAAGALLAGRIVLATAALVLLAAARPDLGSHVAGAALAIGGLVAAVRGLGQQSASSRAGIALVSAVGALAFGLIVRGVLADEVVWAVALTAIGTVALIACDRPPPRLERAAIPRANDVASPVAHRHLGPST